MFLSLPKDQAAVIRQKLLECLGGDFQRAVRNKISDAVAEVARQFYENSTSQTPTPAWTSKDTNLAVGQVYNICLTLQ